MSYSYDTLPHVPGAIRVFTLFPSHDFDAPLYGQLQHKLRQESQYHAISYVWGDPTPCTTIYLDKSQLSIGKHLSDVLRNIRSPEEPLNLWIDAICINQSDTGERNTQVQDMANTYKDARQVIGWVGELTQEAPRGFQLFRDLVSRINDEDFGTFVDGYIRDVSNDLNWLALVDLLDRPYWIRLWILQEVSVNPRVSLRFGGNPKDEIKVQDLFEWDYVRFEVVSRWREHRRNDYEASFIQRFDSTMNNVYNIGYTPDMYPLKVEELQPFLLSIMWWVFVLKSSGLYLRLGGPIRASAYHCRL